MIAQIVGIWFVAQFWATVGLIAFGVAAVAYSHLRPVGRKG